MLVVSIMTELCTGVFTQQLDDNCMTYQQTSDWFSRIEHHACRFLRYYKGHQND